MARVLVLGSVMFVVVSADSSGDVRLPSDRRSQEEWQRDWYERNRFRLGVPPLSSNPIPFDRSPKRNVAGNANDISSSIEIGKTDGKSRLLIPRKVAMQIMQAEPGFPGTPQNGGTTGNKRSTGSGVLPPMSTSTIGALRTTIVGVLMSLALCSCVLLRSRPRLLGSVGVLALMAMAATLWHADSAHGDLPVKGWFGWKRQPGRGIRDVRTPWQPPVATPIVPANNTPAPATITLELTNGPHIVLLVGDDFPIEQLQRPASPVGHSIIQPSDSAQLPSESVFPIRRNKPTIPGSTAP